MRLLDRVVNSPEETPVAISNGLPLRLPGVGARSKELRECPLRYVLDPVASENCLRLAFEEEELFDPGNELLRLPADRFWVEWLCDEKYSDLRRIGVFVEASADGRRGLVTGYWCDDQGRADMVPASTVFDLDRVLPTSAGLRLRHADYRHLDRLFEHAVLQVEPAWKQYFRCRAGGDFGSSMEEVGCACWYFLPLALAFSAMMNSRDVVEEKSSDLERLNAARIRRGQAALLEHTEVRMKLGSGPAAGAARSNASGRSTPRLHFVRGHFVHRGGKRFWRASHLRGDADLQCLSKTVQVIGTMHGPRRSGTPPRQIHRLGQHNGAHVRNVLLQDHS